MNNRQNPVAVSTGQSIASDGVTRPVTTISTLTPHTKHKKSYNRLESTNSGLLHEGSSTHLNAQKTGKSLLTTTTPAIQRNPGQAQISSVIGHQKQTMPENIQRLLVLPYSASLERQNLDLLTESDRQQATEERQIDEDALRNITIDDDVPSVTSQVSPIMKSSALAHMRTTVSPSHPHYASHSHQNDHVTVEDDSVLSYAHSPSHRSCLSVQGVRPAEAYVYEFKDTKVEAERRRKQNKNLQHLALNKQVDMTLGESDEENENETRKVKSIFSSSKKPLIVPPDVIIQNLAPSEFSVKSIGSHGEHKTNTSTIEDATYRFLCDENSLLSNQLKTTQLELLQVQEHFQKIYSTYTEHQNHIEHILQIIDKKDFKLKERRHQIVNQRGVVENLSKEKIALLVQVNERGKKLMSAEHANAMLHKQNKTLQQEVNLSQGKSDGAGGYIERAARKDGRLAAEEAQEMARQLQQLRVDLLALQQTHNLALRDHSQYEQDSIRTQEKLNHELALRRDKIDSFQQEMIDMQTVQINQQDTIRSLQEELARLHESEQQARKQLQERDGQVDKQQSEQSSVILSRDNALLKAKSVTLSLSNANDKIVTLSSDNDSLMREINMIRQQLKMSNDNRRNAEQQYRLHVHEKTNTLQTQASLEGELEALRLQYEALKNNYANVCSSLQEHKKELFKQQKEGEDYARIKQAYELSSVELKNLTIKQKELKANSDTQVFALTESRDKYLMKLEMLRTVNAQLTQTIESQKMDVKQMTSSVASLDKDLRQANARKETLEVATRTAEEASMLRELLNMANLKVLQLEHCVKTLDSTAVTEETPAAPSDKSSELEHTVSTLELRLAALGDKYSAECATTGHLRREEAHLQAALEALQKKLLEEKTNLANYKLEATNRIDILHRKISDQDLQLSKYRRQSVTDPV